MPSEITVQVARKVTEDIWPIREISEIVWTEIEAREIRGSIVIDEKQTYQPHSTIQGHHQELRDPSSRKTKGQREKHVIFATKIT